VRHWVALQDTHEAFYCVVDLHAITAGHDPKVLRQRTRVAAAQLFALGLDPDRCTLFVQSQVPEHAQLGWVLSCITGFGEASRMTQFKDKSQKQGSERASVGLFTYPILQAADILLYRRGTWRAQQHLEYPGRPQHQLRQPSRSCPTSSVAKITDLGPTARCRSRLLARRHHRPADDPARSAKDGRRSPTPAGDRLGAEVSGRLLLTIHSALSGRSIDDLVAGYAGKGYGDLKKELAEVVAEFVRPVQERTRSYLDDTAQLDKLLALGAEKARTVASATLARAYERVGFFPPVRVG
jgi:tryptophanyl-tRNA synthetase